MKDALSGLSPEILAIAQELQGFVGKVMGTFSIQFDHMGRPCQIDKRIIVKLKEREKRKG